MTIRVFDPAASPPVERHLPLDTLQVRGSRGGLDIAPDTVGHVDFRQLVGLSTFRTAVPGGERVHLLLFVQGRPRPLDIDPRRIRFEDFTALKSLPSGLEKFRKLAVGLAQAAPRMLVDRPTAGFLKGGAIPLLRHEPVLMATAFAANLKDELVAAANPPTPPAPAVPLRMAPARPAPPPTPAPASAPAPAVPALSAQGLIGLAPEPAAPAAPPAVRRSGSATTGSEPASTAPARSWKSSMNRRDPGQEIIEKFRKRKKKQYLALIPAVVAAAGVATAPPGVSPMSIAAGIVVTAVLIFSFFNWRCPSCEKYLGKGLAPRRCPRCGVRLA